MFMQPLDNDTNVNHKFSVANCKTHNETLQKVLAVLNPERGGEGA